MDYSLGPRAAAAGYRLLCYESIGSTSTEALECGRAGDPGRLWIAAGTQTAGHGRRGRPWESATGNLAASLLVPAGVSPTDMAKLGFVAGLALEEAVRTAAPGVSVRIALDASERQSRLRLKWPNDLLADGAKLAGILLETVASSTGSRQVVVGFGVNVAHAPEGTPYPATSLAQCGAQVSARDLFRQLSESWTRFNDLWDEGCGFREIRRLWLERAAGLGAPIAVSTGETVLRGIFETLDEEGMLVVRDSAGGLRKVAAGDVHFGAAATARP